MPTLSRSTDTARRQGYSPMKLAWLVAVLLFAAAYITAQEQTYPIVVDANVGHVHGPLPCVTPYSAAYATVGAAVNASTTLAGATILVCPGTYPEQITISKSLTLRGVTNTAANTGAAVITVPASGLVFNFTSAQAFFGRLVAAQVLIQASNVTLTDIGVDGAGALNGCSNILIGIGFDANSSGLLRRVAARNQSVPNGTGQYCSLGAGIFSLTGNGVTLQDSVVRGFDGAGFASSGASSVVIRTTVFTQVNGAGVGGFRINSVCVGAVAGSVEVSNNTLANCERGLVLSDSVQATIGLNTIVSVAGNPAATGIECGTVCTLAKIFYNTIAGADVGIFGGSQGFSGCSIQYNDISGASSAIVSLSSGNTVSYNTINDAGLGIAGVSGNAVSNNTFLNVATLTQ